MIDRGESWYTVSFRLSGDLLPVDDIADKIGLVPTSIGRKGQHIRDNPRYTKHRTNFWYRTFTSDTSCRFEEQMTGMLNTLEPLAAQLKEIMSIPGVEGEIILGYGSESGQGGAYFTKNMMQSISELGFGLEIDLYPPGDPEPDLSK